MKRMLKRLILITFAIVLIVSEVGIVGSADTAFTIKAGSVTANAGDTVIVPIRLENNPGLAGLQIDIEYDNQALIPLSVSQGTVLKGELIYNLTYKPNTMRFVYASATNFVKDGELCFISFKVVGNYATQTKSPISLNNLTFGSISDNKIIDVPVINENGFVTIEASVKTQPPSVVESKPEESIIESKPGTSIIEPKPGGNITAGEKEKDGAGVTGNTDSVKKVAFSDVSGSYEWAKQYVEYIATLGIIGGVGGDKFAPGSSIKRGDFVKILAGIAGVKTGTIPSAAKYKDISNNHPYSKIIAWAADAGIVSGYGDNTFRPDSLITREDIAVMLLRLTKHLNLSLSSAKAQTVFLDDAQISVYAKEAVYQMQKAGILSGKGPKTFSPKLSASRAEAAKMVAILVQEIRK